MPVMKNSKGQLTLYALACGYIELSETNNIRTKLWLEPGSAPYHVRQHDFNKHERVFWECFETLTEARNYFQVKSK